VVFVNEWFLRRSGKHADELMGHRLTDVFPHLIGSYFCSRLALSVKTGFPAMMSHSLHAPPLPLFSWSAARETGAEPEVALPQMPLSEHVVNDYQTLRLSLKAHPMSFLRERLRAERVVTCQELRGLRDGQFVKLASRSGETSLRAKLTDRVSPGVVYTTFHHPTTQANVITTDFSDWATNCPEYKVTAVQVSPSNGPTEWQEEYEAQAEQSRRILAAE
jgi:predicted molibdopterin-dependent oxidoreductase YjgC